MPCTNPCLAPIRTPARRSFDANCQNHQWFRMRKVETRMWANAQRDGRPTEYRSRPLFNAAKFG